MAPARVVEKVAIEGRTPVLEDPHELAAREVIGHLVLEQKVQSYAVQRGTEHEIDVVEYQGPGDGHRNRLATFLELPSVDGPAGAHTVPDTPVRRQIPRCLRLWICLLYTSDAADE